MNSIPCVIMRGGTSRGPFIRMKDLPSDQSQQADILLSLMGSGHALQIDGIGGGDPLTSKVAIVERSSHPDADVDYLFAQVDVVNKRVDFNPNCGNMLSAVGPYAIETGLVKVINGEADFGINMISAQSSEVRFTPLLRDPFVLALRSDHPLASKKQIEWSDLEDVRLITVSRDSGNRILLDNALSAEGIHLNSFYEVQHLSTSLGLVESGLGVAILPRMTMPGPDHDTLCSRDLPEPRIQRSIGLVRSNTHSLSSTAQLFIDLLLEHWVKESI